MAQKNNIEFSANVLSSGLKVVVETAIDVKGNYQEGQVGVFRAAPPLLILNNFFKQLQFLK